MINCKWNITAPVNENKLKIKYNSILLIAYTFFIDVIRLQPSFFMKVTLKFNDTKNMVNYTRHYLIKWNEIYVMVINLISPWMLSKIAMEDMVHIYFATFNYMSAISCLDILNVSKKLMACSMLLLRKNTFILILLVSFPKVFLVG